MNDLHLRHLLRLYKAFDGDILEALVLGEIAHHNIWGLKNQAAGPHELSALMRRDVHGNLPLLPTNAFSLSLATGIPRQTVRRKIQSLEAKGYIRRTEDGSLYFTAQVAEQFSSLTSEAVDDFLATMEQARSFQAHAGHAPSEPSRASVRAPRTRAPR